mgnify:CR=1 FL=1
MLLKNYQILINDTQLDADKWKATKLNASFVKPIMFKVTKLNAGILIAWT